jgi:hypothetical protein
MTGTDSGRATGGDGPSGPEPDERDEAPDRGKPPPGEEGAAAGDPPAIDLDTARDRAS